MPFPSEIFRSYDIRGTTDQLSTDLAQAIGAAVVRMTGAKTVVVGRDMRPTSPEFSEAVIRGVRTAGANAVDIGMVTTPMFNFALTEYAEHEAGVMVTASHNPAEYNGFKVLRGDGMPVSGEEVHQAILSSREIASPAPPVRNDGKLDVLKPYLDKLFALVEMPSLAGMKVVVDAGNGMGGVILPAFFERLDCRMIPMFFEPDGRFPNHEANPVKSETLEDLTAKVLDANASVGIALDGDSDRVGFVDERGGFVRGDHVLALLTKERLRAHAGGAVVWSPNASWAVRDAVGEAGGKSVWERVGRTNLIRRMQAEEAVLGGEVSAHYFYPEFGYLESTEFTILLVLKLMAEREASLSRLVEPFRKYHSPGEVNFEVAKKDEVLAALKERYAPDASLVNELDGVRVEFDDWWFNVRKSNTEPLVRLNLEATSKELMEAKLGEIAAIIKTF